MIAGERPPHLGQITNSRAASTCGAGRSRLYRRARWHEGCVRQSGLDRGVALGMFNAHQGLGEILFAIYLVVLVVVLIMGRQGRTAPSWLIGIAHTLLTLQIVLGVIL